MKHSQNIKNFKQDQAKSNITSGKNINFKVHRLEIKEKTNGQVIYLLQGGELGLRALVGT